MKKIEFIIATAIVIIMLASCTKEDGVLSDLTTSEITSTLDGDSWKVTYYYDNSDDESTNDFSGYTFLFNTDGSIIASNGSSDFTGTWVIKNSDDNPKYDKEIDLTITGNKQMEQVDGKWLITELSETTMQLKDDSRAEEMHFEKL